MLNFQLHENCIKWLKSEGIYYHNARGGGWTGKGAPDLFVCLNGEFTAFELKVAEEEMLPNQIVHKKRILENGGRHYCPRSLEEFVYLVRKIQKEKVLGGVINEGADD